MACGGCNTSTGLTKDQVENLINKLIDDGKLQGGLKTCDGDNLPSGSKVLTCAILADAVNDLLKEGKVDVITDVKIENGKLVVVDGTGKENKLTTPFVSDLSFNSEDNKLTWVQDGKDKSATLPYVKAVEGATGVVLTLPNGDKVELPKAGTALTADNLDYTIQKDANIPGKFGVKLGDGLEAAANGIKIKVGEGLKVDENGNLVVDNDIAPKRITSINNGEYNLGFHTFSGYSGSTTGLPLDINSEDKEQGMSPTPTGSYDYNGYYIASAGQVDVWLQGVDHTAWFIMNDAGVNPDGTLVDPNAWGKWQKLDNASSVTNDIINSMQNQLTSLARTKVDKSSLVRLMDASGTVTLGYIAKTNS